MMLSLLMAVMLSPAGGGVSGNVTEVQKNDLLTESCFVTGETFFIREGYREFYFSGEVYQYILTHKEDYDFYTVQLDISNDGYCDFYGMRLAFAEDYGTRAVLESSNFSVGPYLWKRGETSGVYYVALVDRTRFASEEEIIRFLKEAPLCFTYEGELYDLIELGSRTVTINSDGE